MGPKLPLTRQQTSNGHIWRQADGSVFSFAEHEEWVWERLEELARLHERMDCLPDPEKD